MSSSDKYDVFIAGLGPWGAAAAWQLAKRGLRVLGVDQYKPPHMYGSHSGATRLARQSSSAGNQYVPLTERTFQLWDELSRTTDETIVEKSGTVFIGEPGSAWFDRTRSSLGQSNFTHEIFDNAAARERFPYINFHDGEIAVWEPNGTVLRVVAAIEALHSEAKRHGAELHVDETVLGWSTDEDGLTTVTTSKGTYSTDKLLITVGARANKFLGKHFPYTVDRQVLANFPNSGGYLPSIYISAPAGSDLPPSYGCTEPNGDWKFSVPGANEYIDPDDISQDLKDGDLQRIQSVIAERLPTVSTEPVSATVCMWSEVEDGHWIVGPHPDEPGVIIGLGDMGRGFRYAPVIGEILADLVQGKERADANLFSPSRFEFAPA